MNSLVRRGGQITAVIVSILGVAGRAEAALALQMATATFSQSDFGNFSASTAVDGSLGNSLGWAIYPAIADQTAVFETATDAGFAGGTLLTFTLSQLFGGQHTIGHLRLSATTDDRSTFADGLQTGGDVAANWTVLSPFSATATNGALLTIQSGRSILASGPSPDTSVYTITAGTLLTGITGFRLEALTDSSLPFGGPGRQPTNGNFVLTESQVDAVVATPEPSVLASTAIGVLMALGYGWRRCGRTAA